jgi:hypothetical protein
LPLGPEPDQRNVPGSGISEVVALEDLPLGIEKLERQDGNPIRILVRP